MSKFRRLANVAHLAPTTTRYQKVTNDPSKLLVFLSQIICWGQKVDRGYGYFLKKSHPSKNLSLVFSVAGLVFLDYALNKCSYQAIIMSSL